MTARPTIAVTGATGYVGGLVARALGGSATDLRLLVRDPARAPEIPGADVFAVSYDDREAAVAALDGVQTVLMVSAAESADRLEQHLTFVDAVAAAGVEHIVYTSFFGAAPDAVFTLARDHFATEERIKASGMGYTLLRDNFYLDFLPALVGEDGVIRGPAAEGRFAPVARADVARSAVAALTAPHHHRGLTYDLTGPESLTMSEAADILAEHLGREVRYHDETVEEAYASRRRWEAPDWQYDAWVSTYTAIAAGQLDGVSSAVATLTGREPLGLRDYLAAGE
ncbi:SDR family oxidoreductase [Nocardioides sp. NPDC006273]|uniref:SDR family oxidoreductase n=1 Tax=Nocardioides sp. NPDC006273 TaxID=3155598 RepID=UPI0033B3018B